MTDTNFAKAYVGADYFSEFQTKALVDWVLSMSDNRLEIVRNQLMHAIAAYDTMKDDFMVGTALLARSQTVMIEIERRGGIPMLNPVCVPWGKSITDGTNWSLTDYTKLPSPEERGIFVQTEEHPLNVLLQGLPEDSRPLTVNNVPIKNDTDQFIRLPDSLNDPDEAEAYRMADNDFSGLPVVSCEIIDITNSNKFDASLLSEVTTFTTVNETFYQTDDTLQSVENEVDLIAQFAADSNMPFQEPEYDARIQESAVDAAIAQLINPRTLDTEWVSDTEN